MSIELKPCPICGSNAFFIERIKNYGHGDSPIEWSVRCKCGLRTKGIPTGYEGSELDCKTKAAAIWNHRN